MENNAYINPSINHICWTLKIVILCYKIMLFGVVNLSKCGIHDKGIKETC